MRRFRSSGISVDTTEKGNNGSPSPPSSNESRNSRSSVGSNGSRFKMKFRRNKSKKDARSDMRKRTPNKGQANKKSNFKFKDPTLSSTKQPVKCLSPQADMRLQLLPRIAEYKERSWISEIDEQRLMQLLADNPVAFGKQKDNAAIQVKRVLDKIRHDNMLLQTSSRSFNQRLEEEEEEEKVQFDKAKINDNDTSKDNVLDDTVDSDDFKENENTMKQKQHRHIQGTDSEKPSFSTASNRGNSSTKKSILDPRDAWEDQIVKDETHMEDIYVEMCFFARLGFIQPPCCLKCVHKECVLGQDPVEQCQRWVSWRKNANTLIHPHHLQDNVVLVRCNIAQRLLQGETIDSHEWDEVQKELLRH